MTALIVDKLDIRERAGRSCLEFRILVEDSHNNLSTYEEYAEYEDVEPLAADLIYYLFNLPTWINEMGRIPNFKEKVRGRI